MLPTEDEVISKLMEKKTVTIRTTKKNNNDNNNIQLKESD